MLLELEFYKRNEKKGHSSIAKIGWAVDVRMEIQTAYAKNYC
jgi:hypothetical protein